MLVDTRNHRVGRRLRSTCAKDAESMQRISLARFNSRYSGPNTCSRRVSLPARPGGPTLSRLARPTLLGYVSAVQPIFAAIESIAAHCELCSSSAPVPEERADRAHTMNTLSVFRRQSHPKDWSLRNFRGDSLSRPGATSPCKQGSGTKKNRRTSVRRFFNFGCGGRI